MSSLVTTILALRLVPKSWNGTSEPERSPIPSDCWSPASIARGLFEGVGDLEDAELITVATHDLNPDRQSLGREAGGYRHRRTKRCRNPVRGLHLVAVLGEQVFKRDPASPPADV